MHKVLVLDANQRSALAIIRSLGSRGIEIVAADAVSKPIGAASRYAAALAHYPDPARHVSEFLGKITDIIRKLEIDTVVPATDLTTMLLVGQTTLGNNVRIACPPAAGYEALSDKHRLLVLASKLGILAPETRVARTLEQIVDAVGEFGYPAVLKPARSRFLKNDQVISTSVLTVPDPDCLSEKLEQLSWIDDMPCLVQRFVPGSGAGVFTAYSAQGPIAWFAHRRIREKPPSGGVSVLSESVPVDPLMQSISTSLLSAVAWTGVAMVEFRVGPDRMPYLMEVNGRFWGSLQLAIDCGVDFPWILLQLTHDRPFTAPEPYPAGKRLRWLLGDLDSLLIQLHRGRGDLSHKARAAGRFLGTFLDYRCRQEILRLSDPGPGIREAVGWIGAICKRPAP